MNPWQPLDDELARWRDAGRVATMWLRDDDACRDSPALRRLVTIASARSVPVAIAAIPALLEPTLADAVAGCRVATIVQHGYAHRNHAPAGERNWELGAHRPLAQCVDELRAGRERLASAFGERFVAALVPPWNRIDASVVEALPSAGLHGLSTFGPLAARSPAPGVVRCNAHVDVIAWRSGRTFVGAARATALLVEHLAARRRGEADAEEATGLLTHHLDMSEPAWQFVDELLQRTQCHDAVRWLAASELFAS